MIVAETGRTADEVLHEHCDNISNHQLGRLRRADHLAEIYHQSQFRHTGEKYITHTNGVEHILVILGFVRDILMRICAKLHDVIEDCDPKFREHLRYMIRKHFGWIAYLIIETLTKKNGADYPEQLRRSQNLRFLGLWRVIFIKLADMLFNLTTIEGFRDYRKEMKQYRKMSRIVREVIIPQRRSIPRKHLGKYEELLASVTRLLPVKRLETIRREREQDLSYFPSF